MARRRKEIPWWNALGPISTSVMENETLEFGERAALHVRFETYALQEGQLPSYVAFHVAIANDDR